MVRNVTQVERIYWSDLTNNKRVMQIAATDEGLCYVGTWSENFEDLEEWVVRQYPGAKLVRDQNKLQPYTQELVEYLQGKREKFTISFHYRGTPFQQAVWNALVQIPYGQTRSYADIAEQIAKPAAVRAVGAAVGANPTLIVVPCHRVINKNGALGGFRGGLDVKIELLELERNFEFKKV